MTAITRPCLLLALFMLLLCVCSAKKFPFKKNLKKNDILGVKKAGGGDTAKDDSQEEQPANPPPQHNLPVTTKEDEGVWLPVNRTKPGWPSDIVCKQGTSHCKRECAGGRPNEILYMYHNHAGIRDRLENFEYVSELAAYTCATVYVHTPYEMLHTNHNFGRPVSKDLKWSDFFDVTLHDGTPVMFALGEETFREQDANDWEIFETWTAHNKYDRKNKWKLDMWHSFQKAVELSMKPDTKFLWKLNRDVYRTKNLLKALKHEGPMEQYGVPTTTVMGPSIAHEKHVRYTRTERSDVLMLIADDMWQTLQEKYPGRIMGAWHIRRGDSKGGCNTDIPRMREYVKCTFGNVDQKILLMIQTDETSKKYLKDMDDAFKRFATNVDVVWMDPIVLQHQKELPAKFRNNFHTYEIGAALADVASVFKLEHRRTLDCEACHNLKKDLNGL